jgi:hypothetical protein
MLAKVQKSNSLELSTEKIKPKNHLAKIQTCDYDEFPKRRHLRLENIVQATKKVKINLKSTK